MGSTVAPRSSIRLFSAWELQTCRYQSKVPVLCSCFHYINFTHITIKQLKLAHFLFMTASCCRLIVSIHFSCISFDFFQSSLCLNLSFFSLITLFASSFIFSKVTMDLSSSGRGPLKFAHLSRGASFTVSWKTKSQRSQTINVKINTFNLYIAFAEFML